MTAPPFGGAVFFVAEGQQNKKLFLPLYSRCVRQTYFLGKRFSNPQR
jgi:hypothetical protein